MTNLYEMYSTNKEAEKNGTPLVYGPVTIYAKRAGGSNREYASCLAEKTKLLHTTKTEITAEDADQLLAEVYAETIIVGWDNLTNKAGEVIEYNKTNCIKLLLDLPDFATKLQYHVQNFKTFQVEDDIKN